MRRSPYDDALRAAVWKLMETAEETRRALPRAQDAADHSHDHDLGSLLYRLRQRLSTAMNDVTKALATPPAPAPSGSVEEVAVRLVENWVADECPDTSVEADERLATMIIAALTAAQASERKACVLDVLAEKRAGLNSTDPWNVSLDFAAARILLRDGQNTGRIADALDEADAALRARRDGA